MSEHDEPGDATTAVVVAFLQMLRDDRARGAARSLAEYQARFPGFDGAIELALREHDRDGDDDGGDGDDHDGEPAPAEDARSPARFPSRGARRYRLGEELGRGGMGTVMQAWDHDLRRTVAMKLLGGDRRRAGSASSEQLARFVEEAQITGRLEHPSIPPVHELGLDGDGRAYFTMALVRGATFEEVIGAVQHGDDGWTLPRAVEALLRACEAVAFAHSRGVIHRDLKPANIMVGRFGETYVMDWGLARELDDAPHGAGAPRVADPATSGDGSVLGTPAYMAPEQARGERDAVGKPADVYALGAILYHLLAGRAPYAALGTAASWQEAVDRVLAAPPPPIAQVAPRVPAELAAICERAMARDVVARYPGVAEFAAELRAFLDLRVVHAYRTGALAELRKWIARNHTAAAACAAALVVLVAGVLVSLSLERTASAHATEAAEAAARAQANFDVAAGAIHELLLEVGYETVWSLPKLGPVRQRLLEKALAYCERLEARGDDDPRVSAHLASAHGALSDAFLAIGDLDACESHQRLTVEHWRRVSAAAPDDEAVRLRAIQSARALGAVLARRGKSVEAIALLRALLPELDAMRADDPGRAIDSARSMVLTALARSLPPGEESLDAARRAVAIGEEIARDAPDRFGVWQSLAAACSAESTILERLTRFADAERSARRAVDAWQHADEVYPRLDFATERASSLTRVATLCFRQHRHDDGEAAIHDAIEALREIAVAHTERPRSHADLSIALANLGASLVVRERYEDARPLLLEAIAAMRTALASVPDHDDWTRNLARQLSNLCKVESAAGDHAALVARAEELAKTTGLGAESVDAAGFVCQSIAMLDADATLDAGAARRLRDERSNRVLALLREGFARGWHDASVLDHRAFTAVRDLPEFEALRSELRARRDG